MGSREDLEEMKNSLLDSIDKSDVKSFYKNLEKFLHQMKDILDPAEFADLEQLLANKKKAMRPIATNHEYVLFLVVTAFIISVFGEKNHHNTGFNCVIK